MTPLATAPTMFRIPTDTKIEAFQYQAQPILVSLVQDRFSRRMAQEIVTLWDCSSNEQAFTACVEQTQHKYRLNGSNQPVKGIILYYEIFYSLLRSIQNEPVRPPLATDIYDPVTPDGYLYGRIVSSAQPVVSDQELLANLIDSGLADPVHDATALQDFPAHVRVPLSTSASLRIHGSRVQDAIGTISHEERANSVASVTQDSVDALRTSLRDFSWGRFISMKAHLSHKIQCKMAA